MISHKIGSIISRQGFVGFRDIFSRLKQEFKAHIKQCSPK